MNKVEKNGQCYLADLKYKTKLHVTEVKEKAGGCVMYDLVSCTSKLYSTKNWISQNKFVKNKIVFMWHSEQKRIIHNLLKFELAYFLREKFPYALFWLSFICTDLVHRPSPDKVI